MYLLSQPRSIDHGVAEEFQWRVDFDPFVALTFWWHCALESGLRPETVQTFLPTQACIGAQLSDCPGNGVWSRIACYV
jgi:hypothetical protein